MAIVINGSGTVTGLAVGGLPDGTVDAGTLATNSVDSAELIDGAIDTSHIAANQITSAILPTGSVVQVVNTQTGAKATGTTTVSWDDTIPQSGEGDQYMSLAITPTSATNKLLIRVQTHGSFQQATTSVVALFQDSTASALSATGKEVEVGTHEFNFTHYMTAGTTSATTFKVRAGAKAAGQYTFNGFDNERRLGGVMASSITITEVQG